MKDFLLEKCNQFLNEFEKFANDIKSFNEKVDILLLDELDFDLPDDYKYILSRMNGFSLLGSEVYGVDFHSDVSLPKIAKREQNDVEFLMPKHIIPFSPDGRGNHYCFNLQELDRETNTCPIIFWQYGYSNEKLRNIEIVNSSFVDWLNEVLIEWSLDDYDYLGNEK